jgi:hypothetical protein
LQPRSYLHFLLELFVTNISVDNLENCQYNLDGAKQEVRQVAAGYPTRHIPAAKEIYVQQTRHNFYVHVVKAM